jgi:type IV pilus assembly protein PilY1
VGSCNPDDLGYTYGQPNIGRLANGKWVVLVPTGYYPDCSKNDAPPNCQTLPGAANEYSALFVLDAQTGEQIAELKTPTTITGVTSYGLSSPVLGDYDNDQVDDVAFAGDLAGNLWRFDLKSSSPADWSVSLAYKGISDSSGNQGVQPITVMPRLFPDPTTNRFMVVFGTGKYLGASDNTSDSAPTQAIYGIRDKSDTSTIEQSDLEQRYLFETQITDPTDPNYGSTLRGLCSNSDASASNCDNVDSLDPLKGGWRIDLSVPTASGERVVVTPAAIFDSNTAIISTLIPGSTNPCNPTVQGSIMLLEATNGGAGGGVSSIGGYPYIGGRVDNVRTSGTIPVTTTVGGGQVLLPGLTLTGNKKNPDAPFAGDAPIWRRRSWSVINNVH